MFRVVSSYLVSTKFCRNFVRVSSGPEIGAYYHEFFLRDKPYLAAQMFCKNARTVLAMATSETSPSPESLEASPVATQPSATASSSLPTFTPALLAALSKSPAQNTDNNLALASGPSFASPTNVQLLEMHVLQQEQANRTLLDHAMALSIQQRQEQSEKIAAQQARLGQMRQLMQLLAQQQRSGSPSNPRASAA
jgi:hypothetical protein